MMLVSLLLILLFTFAVSVPFKDTGGRLREDATCSWNKCPPSDRGDGVINVHLLPHTHDDLGWIKTVDQYYWGSKPDLVPVGVQYIYNTVIDELEKHPDRRFSFAETGFLMRWIESHDDFQRHRLQKLVKRGQIEIIGGGWVQNDEASSHYVDIIDQFTLGLHKLEQLFGECGQPKVGWQIDPFGHSREMANLYGMMGYSSLFFARIHYLEKELRLQNKSLEFIWNASDDLKTQILTGAFFQDNYGPPPGFCFDAMCGDDPIQYNPDLEGYNVEEKVKLFVNHVTNQSSFQRTTNVMLLMGSDFQYTNANMWYENLDKLIQIINSRKDLKIHVAYSTPSCYVNAITSAQPRLPVKNDDFFPYASSEHSLWTGYFTSRPAFKEMIRKASSYLQLAKQLDAQFFLGPEDDSDVEVMQRASALAQHHDAVTGTAKENVTRDYEKRLHKGLLELQSVIDDTMDKAIFNYSRGDTAKGTLCLLSNETICPITSANGIVAITIFNSKAQTAKTVVKVPYYWRNAVVIDPKGNKAPAQLVKTFQIPTIHTAETAPFELYFPVEVAPLGFSTYFIDNSTSTRESITSRSSKKIAAKSNNEPKTSIENEFLRVNFDENGFLCCIHDKVQNITRKLRQQFFYYEGQNKTSSQPSGAYIFRPAQQDPKPFNPTIKLEVVKGPLIQEVRQTISPWVYQIIRLDANSTHIQFDWIVGPIPKEEKNPIAKEIVTRYITDIASNDIFYTDSNGRQMIKRRANFHPSFKYVDSEPAAANYYPVTNRVFINDDKSQLTVLVDRAEGATSRNGYIELMLHRRCFADDHWGVEEALDEPGTDGKGLVVRGTHWILLGKEKNAANVHRPLAQTLFNRPIMSFAPIKSIAEYKQKYTTEYSGLTRELPSFVNLLSLEKRGAHDKLLIRLEHIFQSEEDEKNSQPKVVDLTNLFTQFTIDEINFLYLGANMNKTTIIPQGRQISLNPMDIVTMECHVSKKKKSLLQNVK